MTSPRSLPMIAAALAFAAGALVLALGDETLQVLDIEHVERPASSGHSDERTSAPLVAAPRAERVHTVTATPTPVVVPSEATASEEARQDLDDTMTLYTERLDLTTYQATKLRFALLTSYDRQDAREALAKDGVAADIIEGIAARDLADLDAVVDDLLSDQQFTAFVIYSGRIAFCDY